MAGTFPCYTQKEDPVGGYLLFFSEKVIFILLSFDDLYKDLISRRESRVGPTNDCLLPHEQFSISE